MKFKSIGALLLALFLALGAAFLLQDEQPTEDEIQIEQTIHLADLTIEPATISTQIDFTSNKLHIFLERPVASWGEYGYFRWADAEHRRQLHKFGIMQRPVQYDLAYLSNAPPILKPGLII